MSFIVNRLIKWFSKNKSIQLNKIEMEFSITFNFSENKTFSPMWMKMNKTTIKKEHCHLNNFLLNKWKKHHHTVLLTLNLPKVVIRILLYLNLWNHRNQTYHPEWTLKSIRRHNLGRVKGHSLIIVHISLYRDNQSKEYPHHVKERNYVDMKIYKMENKVYWMNFSKNSSINRTINPKTTNREFKPKVKKIKITKINNHSNL